MIRTHDNDVKSHKDSLNNLIKLQTINVTAQKYEMIPQRNAELNVIKLWRTRSERNKCKSLERTNSKSPEKDSAKFRESPKKAKNNN